MALTPEQIEQQLRGIGEELPNSLMDAIQEAADRAVDEIRARMGFKQNSPGGVRDSIRATIDETDYTLGIVMPAHGYFQNYGVTGLKNSTTQLGVDEPVARAFGVSDNYEFQFGTGSGATNNPPRYWGIHYPGINAKNFLRLEEFTTRVAELVNQNLEL